VKKAVAIERDIHEYIEKQKSRDNFKDYFQKSKNDFYKLQKPSLNEYLSSDYKAMKPQSIP